MKRTKKHLIIKLSTDKGFGTKLAKLIQSNTEGIHQIVDVLQICKDGTFIKNDVEHPVGCDLRYYFIMPEWNGSYPAFFKQLVDNAGWPNMLKNKKVMLVGYSGGFSGNIMGCNHMKAVLDYIEADVYRHCAHFTYNGKEEYTYSKELDIFKKLLKQFQS
jgi:hypothetical protein